MSSFYNLPPLWCSLVLCLTTQLVSSSVSSHNSDDALSPPISRLAADTALVISFFLPHRDWAAASIIGGSFRVGLSRCIAMMTLGIDDPKYSSQLNNNDDNDYYSLIVCTMDNFHATCDRIANNAQGWRGAISDGRNLLLLHCPIMRDHCCSSSNSIYTGRIKIVHRGADKYSFNARLSYNHPSNNQGWFLDTISKDGGSNLEFKAVNLQSSQERPILSGNNAGEFRDAWILNGGDIIIAIDNEYHAYFMRYSIHHQKYICENVLKLPDDCIDTNMNLKKCQIRYTMKEEDGEESKQQPMLIGLSSSMNIIFFVDFENNQVYKRSLIKSLGFHCYDCWAISHGGCILVSVCKDQTSFTKDQWSMMVIDITDHNRFVTLFHIPLFAKPESISISLDDTFVRIKMKSLSAKDEVTLVDIRTGEMVILPETESFTHVNWVSGDLFRLKQPETKTFELRSTLDHGCSIIAKGPLDYYDTHSKSMDEGSLIDAKVLVGNKADTSFSLDMIKLRMRCLVQVRWETFQ